MLPCGSHVTSVGWELPIDCRKRRPRMFPRLRALVRSFLLAAEHHHHPAFGIELDHHVRTLVDRPDIVVLIHPHRMRKRPRIQVLPNFTNVLSVGTELE